MNRTFEGKDEIGTFIVDFFNDPEDVLEAFQPYYKTAELADVSDPNLIYDLSEKLQAADIFTMSGVEQFFNVFFVKSKTSAALSTICKPAVDRWQKRYKLAIDAFKDAKDIYERTKKLGDAVMLANAENSFKECKKAKDELEIFKKDLGTFVRFYEFMSQIVDYSDTELEKLNLYARHLRPLLRESIVDDDDVDLSNVVLSHYRLSKIKQQDLKIQESEGSYELEPNSGLGSAKAKDKKEELLSQVIARLNEVFVSDGLSDNDMLNYAYTIRDKVSEDQSVINQMVNNTVDQALLGDFPKALVNAVMDSSDAHDNQKMQLLSDPKKLEQFTRLVFDLLS